ncbi:MerR family transcriptional regulator [Clostridia bacterium]|nr:MerR family transcriptional regulator [Clostridia bacterium]
MGKDGMLSISELARFARVSRTALIYYDAMKLISPAARGENDYRYYSERHVAVVNVISTLKETGMPLKEIAKVIKNRTPESVMTLFSEQERLIDLNIAKLTRAKTLMSELKHNIEEGMAADESKIELKTVAAQPVFLGPRNDYSGGKTLDDALLAFYLWCEQTNGDMDLNYPAWGMFSEERIRRRDWKWPDRFYFKRPDAPDAKLAGTYVVGYTRGDYGRTEALYERLTAYIAANNLEICGPAYEEYPLNEISVTNPDDYLIRVSITVRPASA